MRINVGRGNGGSLNRYLLDERKRAKGFELESPIFCTNMVSSDVAELNAEFQLSADLRSDVKRTIAHYSISFPPGENPNLKTKQAIVKDLLQEMGHQDCQFFAVEHFDQQHKRGVHHLHVATSTINLEGNWVSDKFDRVRLKDVERSLELRHGLQYCPPREKGKRRNLTTGESRQEERTGVPCAKRKLWEVLDKAIADKPDLSTALLRVRVAGAEVRFSEFEDGGKGLSFGLDGKHFPGKRLGDQYSFYGLQQYGGVSYDPNRDDPILREIEHLSPQQCQERLQNRPQAWDASLQLREWVKESLQRSPTQREPKPPAIPTPQPQLVEEQLPSAPHPQPQSAIDPRLSGGLEELRRSMEELQQAFQIEDPQPSSQPQRNAIESIEEPVTWENYKQFLTQAEPEAEPEVELSQPDPQPDPLIEQRLDDIFPTAIEYIEELKRKKNQTVEMQDGTLQFQGRSYWGEWNDTEQRLDYFDPTTDRLLFAARRTDKKTNTWEILEIGDIQPQDLEQHQQIREGLDERRRLRDLAAEKLEKSQEQGWGR